MSGDTIVEHGEKRKKGKDGLSQKRKKWLMPSELTFMVRKILEDPYFVVCKKWRKFVKNREKEEPGLGSINK